MRSLKSIADNPRVTAVVCFDTVLLGYVRLYKSGKPLDYTLVIGSNEYGMEHVSISRFGHDHFPCPDELHELIEHIWEDDKERRQVYTTKERGCIHFYREK